LGIANATKENTMKEILPTELVAGHVHGGPEDRAAGAGAYVTQKPEDKRTHVS